MFLNKIRSQIGWRSFTLVMICLSLTVSGCGKSEDEKDEQTTDEDAPTPPAAGTLSIDLNDMESSSSQMTEGSLLTKAAGTNFIGAGLGLAIVTTAVRVNLAVPVAVLQRAASEDPEYEGNNTWLWSFNTNVNSNTWTANVRGTKTESGSSWAISVSNSTKDANGCCTDFAWFSGTVSNGGNSGTWAVLDQENRTPQKAI